jgi:methylamine---glutamate N-methyltransferase subunit A
MRCRTENPYLALGRRREKEATGSLCGIAAVLYRSLEDSKERPVGLQLREMLQAMRHRGTDSTGVTIAGEHFDSDYVMRLFIPDQSADQETVIGEIERSIADNGGEVNFLTSRGSFYRMGIYFRGNLRTLADSVLATGHAEIHSIGRCSEVIKDVGDARDLDEKHAISKIGGTHGVGHVRLATESIVDIGHSHPFWAYPFPDISVVHNGQLTNYHEMKRKFEQRGFHFQTRNDSEVISVYIADKLSQGQKLRDVLYESLDDLDGTFTYVVTTESGIGMAKDRWSAKPFVVYETDEMVAAASEEVALRRVFPDGLERFEPQENEVLTWNVAIAPVIRGR